MLIRQLMVDATGCRGALDDPDALASALDRAADAVGAKIVQRAQARFVPHGLTAVVILAESHIVVSTWPEHGLALVDVLLCNAEMDPARAWGVIAELLQPTDSAHQTVLRAVKPSTDPGPVG